MKCIRSLILTGILLASFLFILGNNVYAKKTVDKNVLILHSYSQGYKWSDDISQGIKAALINKNSSPNIYIEYMDTRRLKRPNYYEDLYNYYKYKYTVVKFDAIICSDNDAFEFLIRYRDKLFPGVPVVFCGINNYRDDMIKGQKNITGIAEDTDFKSTIDSILRLQPEVSKIAVVTNNDETGRQDGEKVLELLPEYKDKLNFKLYNDIKYDDFIKLSKSFDKNTAILYVDALKDEDNNLIPFEECADIISHQSSVPVYSCWDILLGKGVIGGMMTSALNQGQSAGKTALRILNGEYIGGIPVIKKNPNKYIFDYGELKRFHLDKKTLPKGSIVANKPFSFIAAYRKIVIPTIIAVVLMLLLIIMLTANIKKRKDNEMKLSESYEDLQSAHEELTAVEEELRSKYRELKLKEEKIKFMAYYDDLTKLPNKHFFFERLKCMIESVSKGALIFIDIDNFKDVNDTLGHDYGDILLIAISHMLKEMISQEYEVFRWGGDEFTILIPEFTAKHEIETLSTGIINALKYKLMIDNKQIYISASIGITIFPDDGEDVSVIMKNADTAMYKSKSSGKNRFEFYSKELHKKIYRKMEIEKGLRNALAADELFLNYQPQVDVFTGIVEGAEALLRWKSNELGNISPVEFIPIAEESGLIIPIGEWVIKEACRQNKIWFDKGFRQVIAVNVSLIQFQQNDFVEIVRQVLQETNLPPELLELEITESMLMKSYERNIEIIKVLKGMGVKFSLDDFGTGYSSLSYLRNIPINNLKIDKSFIDGIKITNESGHIIYGITNLAHAMNLNVVAEGVETKEQFEILRKIKCDIIQGYYFSRPLSETDMECFLCSQKHNLL